MACPALPLCGLATTEAERALPDINVRIRAAMVKVSQKLMVHYKAGFCTCRLLQGHQGVAGHVIATGWHKQDAQLQRTALWLSLVCVNDRQRSCEHQGQQTAGIQTHG